MIGGLLEVDGALRGRSSIDAVYDCCLLEELRTIAGDTVDAADILLKQVNGLGTTNKRTDDSLL